MKKTNKRINDEQRDISYGEIVALQQEFETQLDEHGVIFDNDEDYDEAFFDFVQQYIDGDDDPQINWENAKVRPVRDSKRRVKDGYYDDEEDNELIFKQIAEQIRDGYRSGYDPVSWSLDIGANDGRDISDFSEEDQNIIYNDLSYPIEDGYDNYLGVEVELSDGETVYVDYDLILD